MNMAGVKCDQCGKFRNKDDIIYIGEDNEEWTECVYCTSNAELEWHGKTRKRKDTEQ